VTVAYPEHLSVS